MKSNTFFFGLIFFLVLAGIPSQVSPQVPLFSGLKKTIVIDPGHGGNDTGARGTDKALEKDVTLSFAKTMKAALHKTYHVTLTRTDDYSIDNQSRTETANRSGADLFISLHAGGNFIHESQGIGIYYYERGPGPDFNPNTDQDALNKNIPPASWTRTQEKYSPISHALAQSLAEHFAKGSLHRNIHVESLALVVLSGASMPAVLIELGYITSPFDEKRMANPDYISDFSKEFCTAIDEYFSIYSK
ncbi:MAG: N-acetylmuramoyl-L-alanine amidase [Proteobacteria bacterium]|nr:N-acetylmuramoyl-L-alanine amidase [Pseudomonadota bacterium]